MVHTFCLKPQLVTISPVLVFDNVILVCVTVTLYLGNLEVKIGLCVWWFFTWVGDHVTASL